MRDKILQGLKTKNSKYGLSQTILEVLADDLAKTVEKDEDVETAVAGVEGQMKIYQSFADQNRTLQTEITNLKKGAEGKTEEKKEEEKKKEGDDKKESGDVPAWAQAIIDSNKTLSESLTAIKTKETQQTNAEKFQSKLKELEVSDDYLKTLPTFERSFQTDEEIDAIAKEYKEKSDVFVQMSANSALGNMAKPSLFGTEVKEGAVSPEVQAIIDSKKA
jgi:hypothetical protein